MSKSIFSQSVAFILILLNSAFFRAEVFNLNEVQLFSSFIDCTLVLHLKSCCTHSLLGFVLLSSNSECGFWFFLTLLRISISQYVENLAIENML